MKKIAIVVLAVFMACFCIAILQQRTTTGTKSAPAIKDPAQEGYPAGPNSDPGPGQYSAPGPTTAPNITPRFSAPPVPEINPDEVPRVLPEDDPPAGPWSGPED